ncbi:protein S100-A1-like [Petromyzon marinus]|uniref:Protein S100-A1-like n=1 Tax=Petromyzon marinus TaxID=7757 RepID=A0AAJ7X230_PETMA|nr:protein S100-A1-like [Petromyzon marinus]
MSDLHAATLKLLATFNELACDSAVKDCLKKETFRSFLKGDKGKSLIQNPVDGFVVSRILRDLGDDKDGDVDFLEFVITIAALKFCCHPNFRAHHERNGRTHALRAFQV